MPVYFSILVQIRTPSCILPALQPLPGRLNHWLRKPKFNSLRLILFITDSVCFQLFKWAQSIHPTCNPSIDHTLCFLHQPLRWLIMYPPVPPSSPGAQLVLRTSTKPFSDLEPPLPLLVPYCLKILSPVFLCVKVKESYTLGALCLLWLPFDIVPNRRSNLTKSFNTWDALIDTFVLYEHSLLLTPVLSVIVVPCFITEWKLWFKKKSYFELFFYHGTTF